jgi:ribosomal protein S19E (S16A)
LSTPSSSATPSMRNREEEPEASGRAGRRNGRASPGREVRGPAQTRGTHEIGQSILYDLRQNLFNRVKGCPSRSLTTAGRKILSRITNDVNHIRSWPPR